MTLPREHRQRWSEEALAVLLAVQGPRRWRYAFDTVLKAPLLSWELRRATKPDASAPWVTVLSGGGLLFVPVLAIASLTVAPSLDPDTALLFFLLSTAGLLPTIAVRSFRTAGWADRGTPRYLAAVLVPLAAAAGLATAGAAALATGSPHAGIAGASTPGIWLAYASVSTQRGRSGPRDQAVLGTLTGTTLAVAPLALQVGAWGPAQLTWASLGGTLLLGVVVLPTLLSWTLLTGVRTLLGRRDITAG